MTYYFVTNSTLTAVAGQFAHTEKISMDTMWLQLVIEGLNNFFNSQEITTIHIRKLLIESRLGLLKQEQKRFNNTEIFGYRAPRFHSKSSCKWLNSNYQNYEIPPQILVLGEKKVREFQLYCEANRAELERLDADNRVDVFWARVGLRFGVTGINPQKINKDNSGTQLADERDMHQLETEIYQLMAELHKLENSPNNSQLVKRLKFSSSYTRALKTSGLLDSADEHGLFVLRQLFDTKEKIKRMLVALYSKQAGIATGLLPEEALIQAGVEPCKNCCA